jgi:hypothetical protein
MSTNPSPRPSLFVNALAIAGALLVVFGLVKVMQHYTRPPAVNQARIEERKKALIEQRALDAEAVANYGWVDQAKGIVRLPVTHAMELTLREYQNPAAARSNLIARLEKATAVAPKPPAAANPFE